MTLTELNKSFSGKFVLHGGLRLLRPRDAVAYIGACLENSLSLHGIDGYHRHSGGEIQPDEALHTDVNSYFNPDQVYKESIRMIEANANDVAVLFVVTLA